MTAKFKVTGMSCAACSARVEKVVRSLDGVESCSVNLLTQDLCVDGNVDSENIKRAVIGAGYGVYEPRKDSEEKSDDKADNATRVLLLRLFASLVMVTV